MVQEILFTEEQIANRAKEIGEQISKEYEGKTILLLGILKGSVPFMAELLKRVKGDVEIDFIQVSSYGSSTKTSGVVKIVKDLDADIKDKNVIVVEDIVDSGLTLDYLKRYLSAKEPASLKVCTLLDKPMRRKADITPDYVGFVVEDKFIVGYGLDFDQKYRELPYITWIKEE